MKFVKIAAGVSFALSFFCIALVFSNSSFTYSYNNQLKLSFIVFGAIAFVLNLISYEQDRKGTPFYNLIFWIGASILFLGLISKLMHFPFTNILIIGGLIISGFSFVISKTSVGKQKKDSDLIDQL
jgi:uncharacterized membrane protein